MLLLYCNSSTYFVNYQKARHDLIFIKQWTGSATLMFLPVISFVLFPTNSGKILEWSKLPFIALIIFAENIPCRINFTCGKQITHPKSLLFCKVAWAIHCSWQDSRPGNIILFHNYILFFHNYTVSKVFSMVFCIFCFILLVECFQGCVF